MQIPQGEGGKGVKIPKDNSNKQNATESKGVSHAKKRRKPSLDEK